MKITKAGYITLDDLGFYDGMDLMRPNGDITDWLRHKSGGLSINCGRCMEIYPGETPLENDDYDDSGKLGDRKSVV